MSLQVDKARSRGFGAEFFVQLRAGAGECDVHDAAVRLVHGIAEERRAVQIIVQQLGLGVVAGLHVGKAAHFSFDPFQHKAHHIDDVAGRRVVDFITINRFRNRVKEEINTVFTQLVLVLADKGFISLDVEYIDGTNPSLHISV